ncbi:MAG: hypothetical protein GXP62_13775 [Oligoflexia bacterium]|nr:hypothetical protein [Oligoflexia bacterium]
MSMWQKWMMPGLVAGFCMIAPSAQAQDSASGPAGDDQASAPKAADATNVAASPETVDPEEKAAAFNRELLSVEEQVNALKERVFRSKATLQLLSEIVAQGSGAGSRATITHVNNLGRSYKIESLSYYLDGQARFSRSSVEGGLDDLDEVKVFDGPISAGTHSLSIAMQLRGSGGLFSYVDDIGFNVQSNATFDVKDGDDCTVRVEAEERGGLTKSFTERPNINFDVRCTRSTEDAGEQ